MKRRDFFRAFAGTSAAIAASSASAIAVASPAPRADRFQYGAWDIRWSGWREPANQHVRAGWWQARDHRTPLMPYATTLGVVQPFAHALDAIDMERTDGHAPCCVMQHTPEEFAAAREWACERLLRLLEKVK